MSLLHQIALTQVYGIGVITARALIGRFGSAEEVFKAQASDLRSIQGIGGKIVESIVNHDSFTRAEEEIRFLEKYHISPLFFTDEGFPQRLKNCYDTPVLLYYKGNADLNSRKIVSIVGTRKATVYGKEICETLIADMKKHDVLVVSGLAYGIDSYAHKTAVKNDIPTVGVLAHGLDRIYPASNRSLAEKMLDAGGLLSEYLSQTIPDKENFPKRNRIIAGISDATIVVEASLKGGALITAEIANSYNRDVFAFPGNINNEFSAGCNYLIKTNRANLISGIKDLEYMLGWNEPEKPAHQKQVSLALNLSDDEKKIVDLIQQSGPVGVDKLFIATNLSQSRLAMLILELEMQGIITSLPGKIYQMA